MIQKPRTFVNLPWTLDELLETSRRVAPRPIKQQTNPTMIKQSNPTMFAAMGNGRRPRCIVRTGKTRHKDVLVGLARSKIALNASPKA